MPNFFLHIINLDFINHKICPIRGSKTVVLRELLDFFSKETTQKDFILYRL